jgi:hypothetical protein
MAEPYVSTCEDGDTGFVEGVDTAFAATQAMVAWAAATGWPLCAECLPEPFLAPYRAHNGDRYFCEADDPRCSGEWWVFGWLPYAEECDKHAPSTETEEGTGA